MAVADIAGKRALLALVVVGVAVLAWLAFARRRSDPTGDSPELDTICASCAWEGRVRIKGGWRRCPHCGETTVHLAAACPKCKKVMPFLDDELYLRDSVRAMSLHADEVLPVCPECGVRAIPKWAAFPKVIRAGE